MNNSRLEEFSLLHGVWEDQRLNEIIPFLEEIASQLDGHKRRSDVAKVTGRTTTLAGVMLVGLGTAGIPFTVGVSAVLIGVGAAVAGSGCATAAGTKLTETAIEVKDMLTKHDIMTTKLQDTIDNLKLKPCNINIDSAAVGQFDPRSKLSLIFKMGLDLGEEVKEMGEAGVGTVRTVLSLIGSARNVKDRSSHAVAQEIRHVVDDLHREVASLRATYLDILVDPTQGPGVSMITQLYPQIPSTKILDSLDHINNPDRDEEGNETLFYYLKKAHSCDNFDSMSFSSNCSETSDCAMSLPLESATGSDNYEYSSNSLLVPPIVPKLYPLFSKSCKVQPVDYTFVSE